LTRTADGLLNVDLVTLFTDFRRTYTRVMDEIADGDRDAPGLQAIVSELTEMTGEIQQLAAGLSEYPEPELERTKTVPSGTLLDQSDYQGGSVTSVPAASATKFPYT